MSLRKTRLTGMQWFILKLMFLSTVVHAGILARILITKRGSWLLVLLGWLLVMGVFVWRFLASKKDRW